LKLRLIPVLAIMKVLDFRGLEGIKYIEAYQILRSFPGSDQIAEDLIGTCP